ncbi:TetR/AcrR family transcriptional regulator [Enterobacter asburiae]|uniref:TetR/AcrR family transcriptional regulator n=1 Tax=Scandinavium sp. UTDF21-P1B TaxID=3446379 RepID=UPI0034933BEA
MIPELATLLSMARYKEFDVEVALNAAIAVFREYGYAATSAQMLTTAMKIGRQSLYDTFGGKWQLYCSAVERYSADETAAHISMLQKEGSAINGIEAMLERVIAEATSPCLGLSSISEFANRETDLQAIRDRAAKGMFEVLKGKISQAQVEGDISSSTLPEQVALFLVANIAGIRMAARGGADESSLHVIKTLAIQALK